MNKSLKVIPLGGLGEVGLNLMVIEFEGEILLLDCGVLFPDLYWLGLDLVLPDFSYLIENEAKIKGLVITHGHEDHIGAIPFLLKKIKLPIIYCSRFAGRLITDKCQEHGVGDKLLTYKVKAGDAVDVGCFNVEFIHVTHSTLETFALAIETPLGLIVHSGDFKFDETPYVGPASDKKRLKELGARKPILLLSDSTNSERCGHSASEKSINEELDHLVSEATGTVIVALFASNIHRVHQLIDISKKHKRQVFLSGRSMERYVNIAIDEGFLPNDLSLLRPIEEIGQYERNEVLVLSTGSQGEARSSLLRLAKNENRYLKIQHDDVVILSSRNIPGNEKSISFVVNELFRLGAIVHYEDMKNIHVSGHAYKSEQLDLLNLVKPQHFIPVHGEYRHLALHAETAREFGLENEKVSVIENGQVWEFDGKTSIVSPESRVKTGRHWVFRDSVGALDDVEILERRVAAKAGIVVITCRVTNRGTDLLRSPSIQLKGFLCSEKLKKQLIEDIQYQSEDAFIHWIADNTDGFTREQSIAAVARRTVRKALDVKPLVIVNIVAN